MAKLMFKPEILIQQNEKTGLRAVTFVEGDKEILIRKGDITIRMAHRDRIECMMYQYGASKVMHWNDRCAAPNANTEPARIKMLDGALMGFVPCKNCWGRTRSFNR